MATYILNRRAFEKLKNLVAAAKFDRAAWSFTADDSNRLLGKNNWTDYAQWFLGVEAGKPDPASTAGVTPTKAWYAFPFSKGATVNLNALRAIIADPAAAGAIADAAKQCLGMAEQHEQDQARASADIGLTGAVSITAAADNSEGSIPKFAMLAYTGGPLALKGWQYPVVVDLAGIEGLDKQRPILRDHDQGRIVGHTTSISVQNGQLIATGLVSGHDTETRQVVEPALRGFPWQASIGAKVIAKEFIPEGQTATANDRLWKGPINIARRTSLGEISFVALGADDNTQARIAASAAEGQTMKFSAWCAAKGFAAAELKDEQKKSMMALYKASADYEEGGEEDDAADAAAKLDITAVDDSVKAIRAEAAMESKRIAAIRKACSKHPEIEAKAIEEGWDASKAELEVLRAERPTPDTSKGRAFHINTGAKIEASAMPGVVAAAAALCGGVQAKYALDGLSDNAKEVATSRQMKGMTLRTIMAMAAQQQNIPFHGVIDDQFLGRLLRAERTLDVQADGFATMSLTGITENILNKAMLQAYGDVPSVVPEIAYETDTNDFKTFKRYRLTASGNMQPVGQDGELKSISLQDESYSNQVVTQGMIMTVTRQILINDDMGALTQIPTLIGREAALYREQQVFQILLNNCATLFPTNNNNGNYLGSTGSALSIANLTTAVKKFREQKDANSRPIMISPDRLLVPPALEATADNLFQGANLVVGALGSTSAKSLDVNLNQHRNKYRPIVSPFMGAQSSIVGTGTPAAYTDTNWLLLANPSSGFAVVQIGYLRGQRVPIIERGEAEFNTLGISLRCYYDFGVAAHDYRCGVWSKGDAA